MHADVYNDAAAVIQRSRYLLKVEDFQTCVQKALLLFVTRDQFVVQPGDALCNLV